MSLVYSDYNMLPKFGKVTSPFFLPKGRLKEKLNEAKKFCCVDSYNHDFVIDNHIRSFILQHTEPGQIVDGTLGRMCLNLYEDIVIHRRHGDKDWTSAAYTFFPNGWTPQAVIGKSFYDIHAPVPGFNLATTSKMVDACINKGPFERYVWGLSFDHQQRISSNYPQLKFDIQNPVLYVKVETQIIVGFPTVEAFMFILRQDFIPEFGIHKPTLLSSLRRMTPEQRAYKSVTDDLITYLER